MPRLIRTPAGGNEALVTRNRLGDYEVTLPGQPGIIGILRSAGHGSRRVWGWSRIHQISFTGRYADMAHAIEGLLHARERTP